MIYQYNDRNQLIRLDTTGLTGNSVVEYRYDADGIRVQTIVDGTQVVNYLVDKNRDYAQVLEERDESGGLHVSYVYGDDLISQHRPSTGSEGNPLYYHYDGIGSTRALTDASQNIATIYTYDAFGNLFSQTGTTANNYLFSGEQFDPTNGFYYLRARWYSQSTGRFLTTDPVEGIRSDPRTLHKYVYVTNNPLLYADPSGLFWPWNPLPPQPYRIRGKLVHQYIERKYQLEHLYLPNDVELERRLYDVPGKEYGVVDIVNWGIEQFYEIEPKNTEEHGRQQINDYLIGFQKSFPKSNMKAGREWPHPRGYKRDVPWLMPNGISRLKYWLSSEHDGLILYEVEGDRKQIKKGKDYKWSWVKEKRGKRLAEIHHNNPLEMDFHTRRYIEIMDMIHNNRIGTWQALMAILITVLQAASQGQPT